MTFVFPDVQVCRVVAGCGSVPSSKLSINGGRYPHELVSILDLVLGLNAGPGALPHWFSGVLVSWAGSSSCRETPRNSDHYTE